MHKKFNEIQTKRSILKNLPKAKHKSNIKAGIGMDYGRLLLCGKNAAVAEMVVFPKEEDMKYGFIKLYNNLRAGGNIPTSITDSIIVPASYEDPEREMKTILLEITRLCKELGVDIISGHTEISDAVICPVVTLTMIGEMPENSRVYSEKIVPAMDIVMCGQTGVMGTVKLLENHKEGLLNRYSKGYLLNAEKLKDYMVLGEEIDIALKHGVIYSHDISTGGVYAALWEMADYADAGIEICHDYIPILQETIEICEYANENPYMIDGCGAVIFVTSDGEKLAEKLYENGYEAAVIGKIMENKDRVITHEEERRFLNSPRYE